MKNQDTTENATAVSVGSSAWLGRVVRVHNGPGGAEIYGTCVSALHAVLGIDGDTALVGMVGDNNLSCVPVRALVHATPQEMQAYAEFEWDRSAFVRKVPLSSPNTKFRDAEDRAAPPL